MPTKKPTAPKTAKKPAYRDEVLRLAKFLMQRTQDAFGTQFEDTAKPKPLSEKAQKMKDYIQSNMSGGYGVAAADLFSILLGENISLSADCVTFKNAAKGALIIPTDNDNGHDYPVDQIAVVSEQGRTQLMIPSHDWRHGNTITNTKTCLRLPTEDEVLDFATTHFDKLTAVLSVVIL